MAIKPFSFVLGAAAGAAAQYFFDSQSGNRRRSVAGDKAAGYARQGSQVVEAAKSSSPGDTEATDLNEASLAHKVETEIFRDEGAPKGKVDVNAEGGVIYLRGELDEDQIEALVKSAEQVDGVERVESLLHTPGTPAPTKS